MKTNNRRISRSIAMVKRGCHGGPFPGHVQVNRDDRRESRPLILTLFEDTSYPSETVRQSKGLPQDMFFSIDQAVNVARDILEQSDFDFKIAKQLIEVIVSRANISANQGLILARGVCDAIIERSRGSAPS
jgi:hypothetical protein